MHLLKYLLLIWSVVLTWLTTSIIVRDAKSVQTLRDETVSRSAAMFMISSVRKSYKYGMISFVYTDVTKVAVIMGANGPETNI